MLSTASISQHTAFSAQITSDQNETFRFLDLPVELREQVFETLLSAGHMSSALNMKLAARSMMTPHCNNLLHQIQEFHNDISLSANIKSMKSHAVRVYALLCHEAHRLDLKLQAEAGETNLPDMLLYNQAFFTTDLKSPILFLTRFKLNNNTFRPSNSLTTTIDYAARLISRVGAPAVYFVQRHLLTLNHKELLDISCKLLDGSAPYAAKILTEHLNKDTFNPGTTRFNNILIAMQTMKGYESGISMNTMKSCIDSEVVESYILRHLPLCSEQELKALRQYGNPRYAERCSHSY